MTQKMYAFQDLQNFNKRFRGNINELFIKFEVNDDQLLPIIVIIKYLVKNVHFSCFFLMCSFGF